MQQLSSDVVYCKICNDKKCGFCIEVCKSCFAQTCDKCVNGFVKIPRKRMIEELEAFAKKEKKKNNKKFDVN
jgi:hypothetical protein